MKQVAWSHSALKDFEGCNRRYHEVKILKKYPFTETDATRYGVKVHAAIEDYIKAGKPLIQEFKMFQPVVDALMNKQGRILPEQKMSLKADLTVCDWFDKEVWVRGIADMLVIDDEAEVAWVVDWKTGSNKYPDKDQLVLMSCMVFEHNPKIKRVNSALIFLLKEDMVKMSMERAEATAEWWKYRERVAKIDACMENNVWNPTQSGLCKKWCVVTTCEFNGLNK